MTSYAWGSTPVNVYARRYHLWGTKTCGAFYGNFYGVRNFDPYGVTFGRLYYALAIAYGRSTGIGNGHIGYLRGLIGVLALNDSFEVTYRSINGGHCRVINENIPVGTCRVGNFTCIKTWYPLGRVKKSTNIHNSGRRRDYRVQIGRSTSLYGATCTTNLSPYHGLGDSLFKGNINYRGHLDNEPTTLV